MRTHGLRKKTPCENCVIRLHSLKTLTLRILYVLLLVDAGSKEKMNDCIKTKMTETFISMAEPSSGLEFKG